MTEPKQRYDELVSSEDLIGWLGVGTDALDNLFKATQTSPQSFEREADHLAKRAAFLSGYMATRGGNGCGDHGHEAGVKEGNKRLKKVSKALGYNA